MFHPVTQRYVGFASTPSDWRALRNVLSMLERQSGRRLPRTHGYSGSSENVSRTRAAIAEHNRTRKPGRFRASSIAESQARDAIAALISGIAEIDDKLAVARQRRETDEYDLLCESRQRYNDVLTGRYHQPPVDFVDGVDDVDGVGNTEGMELDSVVEIDDDLLDTLNDRFR